MKTCSNPECSQINPQELTAFHKKKSSKDGLHSRCKFCCDIVSAKYRKANLDRIKANQIAYHKANLDKARIASAKYRKDNLDKANIASDKCRKANPDKVKATNASYRKNNPGKVNALTAKRRATKLNATPKWLTKAQKLEIEAIYIEAARLTKETDIPHEVDHILPLQGKDVWGLHVPWNLQILKMNENRKKGNKIID
jgi:hypothetical protein